METARRLSKEEMVKRFRTEEILAAAQDVIGREGIQGASLDRIAALAGVAKGTIYLYFSSKEDLVCRVIEALYERLLDQIEDSSSSNGSPRDRLRAVVITHLKFMSGHRDLVQSYFFEGRSGGRKIPDGVVRKLRTMQKRYEEIIAEIIREGIQSGEFRNLNARFAASFLIEMLHGEYLRVPGKGSSDFEKRCSELLDLYFYGVTK